MNESEHGGGIRLAEMALIVLVLAILAAVLLPGFLHSRNSVRSHGGVAATLRRIETAKEQYALDQKKRPGDLVSMKELVQGGYLAAEPKAEAGAYIVGPIGTPASFDEDGGQD